MNIDSGDKATGCLRLREEMSERIKCIGYRSCSLNFVENLYESSHRECFAVVWALLMLRVYFEATIFTIRTDHDSPGYLFNMADATGKMARQRPRLSEMEFDV